MARVCFVPLSTTLDVDELWLFVSRPRMAFQIHVVVDRVPVDILIGPQDGGLGVTHEVSTLDHKAPAEGANRIVASQFCRDYTLSADFDFKRLPDGVYETRYEVETVDRKGERLFYISTPRQYFRVSKGIVSVNANYQ